MSPLGDLEDPRDRLRWGPGPSPVDEEPKKDETEPEAGGTAPCEARTLWGTWEEHGKRYKPWTEVGQETWRTELSERKDPFETPPVTLDTWPALERLGGDPWSWWQNWLKGIGVPS